MHKNSDDQGNPTQSIKTARGQDSVSKSSTSTNSHHNRLPGSVNEVVKKTPKRVLGISRKFLLRAINRRVIARLARRASIGIPLLGFYFAQNAFRNDLSQALNKENLPSIRNGYKVVTAIDGIDLTAQCFMLSGLVSTLFLQTTDVAAVINFPEIMNYADKVSIGCALASTLLGTSIELKKEHDLELLQDQVETETKEASNSTDHSNSQSKSNGPLN